MTVVFFSDQMTVIASPFAAIFSTADTPTHKSLKPRSPRHALNWNLNPLSHWHICTFLARAATGPYLERATLSHSPPRPACPPRSSAAVSSLHSFFFFFVLWGTTDPFLGGRKRGLMLAGCKHHLLHFNKTEQSCATLRRTELDAQGQLYRVLDRRPAVQQFVRTIGCTFLTFNATSDFSPPHKRSSLLIRRDGGRCASINPTEGLVSITGTQLARMTIFIFLK